MLSGLLAHTLRFSPKNTTSLLHISSRVPLRCHRASHQLPRLRQTPPNRAPISTLSRTRLPYSPFFSRLLSSSPTGPTLPPTGKSVLKQPLPLRFFSSNAGAHWQSDAQLPVLSTPAVANWLLLSSTLVFAVIVVGGVTRLTESGLSITEWRPITGVLPPLSLAEWENEFEKYKATPEFRLCVPSVSLPLVSDCS
jgi:Cytochrome oxidase assembly protein